MKARDCSHATAGTEGPGLREAILEADAKHSEYHMDSCCNACELLGKLRTLATRPTDAPAKDIAGEVWDILFNFIIGGRKHEAYEAVRAKFPILPGYEPAAPALSNTAQQPPIDFVTRTANTADAPAREGRPLADTMYTAVEGSRLPPTPAREGRWVCKGCGRKIDNPYNGGHLVETSHPTWCGPVEPVKPARKGE